MFDKKEQGRWWDFGWQLIEGCTKISPACKNCCSLEKEARFGISKEVIFHPERLQRPLKRKKPASYSIWNDLFHESVSFENQFKTFQMIMACPQHLFQILTKRPEIMRERMEKIMFHLKRNYPYRKVILPNVWLGTSAENQDQADKRIPILLDIPAAKRFVSVEPMLGEIDLTKFKNGRCVINSLNGDCDALGETFVGGSKLDWVIVGGESGHNARPMHPEWVRSMPGQCKESNTPFFFKQWGEWIQVGECGNSEDDKRYYDHPKCTRLNIDGGMGFHGENAIYMMKKGRSKTGSELDGVHHKEFPVQICYKTNEICKYNCSGLCKESC